MNRPAIIGLALASVAALWLLTRGKVTTPAAAPVPLFSGDAAAVSSPVIAVDAVEDGPQITETPEKSVTDYLVADFLSLPSDQQEAFQEKLASDAFASGNVQRVGTGVMLGEEGSQWEDTKLIVKTPPVDPLDAAVYSIGDPFRQTPSAA